jgi:transposase
MPSTADRAVSKPAPSTAGFVLPALLPDDPGALKALLQAQQEGFAAELARQLAQQLAEQTKVFEARILELYETMRMARQRLFGRSSESHVGQGLLFNEAEALAEAAPKVIETADIPAQETESTAKSGAAGQRARGKRKPLPSALPRVEVMHDVPEAERTCACGTPMVVIGEAVSEQLDIVPMQVRVLRHIRKRYGCPKGEHAPVTAPAPAQVLPKSNASNDLLAMLLTTKYVDGLPLARFEYVLARAGVIVPRQTLARWAIGVAQALQPVANLMRDTLLEADIMHMDETPVQVLKEPGRAPSRKSQMWVQRGGPPGKPIVLFDYDPSRSQDVPLRLLAGWKGYLMADGLESYGAITFQDGVTRLGCWVHARRRFVDATKLMKTGQTGHAHQALEFIAKLYAIEKSCRDKSVAERFDARQTQSKAVLGAFRSWLDKVKPDVVPSGALGQALGYLDNQWKRLVRYLERGDLPIDNNPAENAIRPFVIGRKAWLFSDTPAGAHASALVYSLVETAKANGFEPFLWLRTVLRELPAATTVEHFEALLPWNQKPTDLATV